MTFSIIHLLFCFLGGLITGLLLSRFLPSQNRQKNESNSSETPTVSTTIAVPPALLDDDQTRVQVRPQPRRAASPPPPIPPVQTGEISEEFTEDLPPGLIPTHTAYTDEIEHTDDIEPEHVLGEDDTLPFRRPEWDTVKK